MSTSWDEASSCPNDGSPGKVEHRRPQPGGGQLVTLTCNQTRCQYHKDGWVVQIRPDNTIPDKIDPRTREKAAPAYHFSNTRRDNILAALEQQTRAEQKPGTEVPNRP